MQTGNNLFKSFSYLSLSNVVIIPATAFATILIAQFLKPHELGILLTAEAFVEMFSFFYTMGFKNSIFQYASKHVDGFNEGLKEAMGNALLVRLLVGTPVGLLIYFIAAKFNPDPVLVKIIGLYVLIEFFMSLSNIFGVVRRALDQFKLIATINATNKIIKLGLIFIVFKYFGGLLELVYAFVLMEVIKFLISFIATMNLIKPRLSLPDIMPMMKDSALYGIFDFLDGAQNKVDRLMINYFLGPSAVAFYSIPSKLNRLIKMVPLSIKQVFLPQLHKVKSKEELKPILSKLVMILVIAGLPLFFGIYFFSKPVLAMFFNEEYQAAIQLAPLFAFIALLWFLNTTPNMLLAAEGDHKGRNIIQLISILLNIGLNIIFIPRFGIIGAVQATIAANLTKFVLMQLRYQTKYANK
ncbi:MAG: flippase [Candidatus Melainabacteria bacterium]|jgi:O-antigen/teichoic acid export membrane protein|nr:flippase [Candidatus Melainabacteria bacterium]